MFASTVLNYMDRQAVAQVRGPLNEAFGLSNEAFGWVQAAFYLTYALFQVPAGYIADRGNLRWTYAGAVGFWSLIGVAAALSPTLGVLLACRAALGVAESFNWPCALRATAAVLPPADRSLGNGIFNSGAAIGAVLTPLLVSALAYYFGWRVAFAVVGVLGFVWVAVWLYVLTPERSLRLNERAPRPEEPARGLSRRAQGLLGGLAAASVVVSLSAIWYGPNAVWFGIALLMFGLLAIARLMPAENLSGSHWAQGFVVITRLRRFWVLVLVSISVNVSWHFLVNWMTTYFQEGRKLGFLMGAQISALPWLAADLGNLGGGALSRWLARGGVEPVRARTRVLAGGAMLIASGVFVGVAPSTTAIVAILSLMALGTAAYMANYFAFGQEVAPRHTGLVVGVLGGLGNLFAAGFLPIAGRIVDRTGGFGPNFVITGLLPLIGVAALVLGWGRPEAGKTDEPNGE
jgi:ACS family hexuronate transporter-like MFS transporter